MQTQPITRVTIDNVVDWMTQQGRTCYAAQLEISESAKSEITAEAGPNGHLCPFTQETLKRIDGEITEIKQRAWDRFQDWATD